VYAVARYRRLRGRWVIPTLWVGAAAKMAPMRLYNTLTRRVEELPPPPGPVRMYFCGPTVYQRIHVGNARPFVISMWLRAWLREQGYEVTLVENVTDVNDKIYEAAPGASAELAAKAAAWYVEDTGLLGLGRPDAEPKATESIPEIVAAIRQLVDGGFAYEVDGDVYFRVARDPRYGQLSRQRPDQVEEQEPNPRKEDPRDFALWKANKPGEDTWWDSPWGRGRPGWHIECSVMAEQHLGSVFEVHGGGLDLVFPHHENELAQSRALGHEFARIWMHNGMLRFVGEKMSKSVGNVVTLREALDEWGRETILLFLMTAHWRSPLDLSEETLAAARAQAETFRNAFVEGGSGEGDWSELARVLDDDFNTADALAVLHGWRAAGVLDSVRRGLELFGLGSLAEQAEAPGEVIELAGARRAARTAGDFAEADRLRGEIESRGWEVRDVKDGFRLVPRR
jgi:cysteinyl-tRNA synthetase